MCALTSARAFAAAICHARPSAPSSRSLNILTVLEPMGLPSRSLLFLLASHSMALTEERKNQSRIAQEIEIFSIFAWLVPTLARKQNLRFWVFCNTICWLLWLINIYETNIWCKENCSFLVESCLCALPETGPNLRTLLLVHCCLHSIGVTMVYWNR